MVGNNKRLARKAYGERQIAKWVKWSWNNKGKISWRELVKKQDEFKIRPLIQFDVKNDYYELNWHVLSGSVNNVRDQSVYYKLIPINDMKGKWSDISFCIDFANKNISVWVNGDKKVNIDKAPINAKLVPTAIYFKHGIYRSFISKYKARHGTDVMPTQIVYYDEVRRGFSIDEVDVNINPSLEIVD